MRTVSVALLSRARDESMNTGREFEGDVTVREQLPGLRYTGPVFVVAAPRGWLGPLLNSNFSKKV